MSDVPDAGDPGGWADDPADGDPTDAVEGDGFVRRLKAALLPDRLDALPALDIGAAHLPGPRPSPVGGDWLDAVVRDDGRVVLVVGDVSGWGVPALVLSCGLRAVLHERLCAGTDLVEALWAADAYLRCEGSARSATIGLVEIDPETGVVRYTTAGHPPPLIWSATGGARFLPATAGAPLATARVWPVQEARLEVDEVVVLFSDGLLERPHRDPATSTVDVVSAVESVAASHATEIDPLLPSVPPLLVDALSRSLVTDLTATTGRSDDVTVLAAQRRSRVRELVLALPVGAEATTVARTEVVAWLREVRPNGFELAAIEHVVEELVRNCVQHAYPGGTGEVRLTVAWAVRGGLTVTVADDGRWRAATGPVGHGLALVSELADSVEVLDEPHGTTVVAQLGLHRPTQVVAPPSTRRPQPASRLKVHYDGERQAVRLVGAVDVDAAERLRILLLRSTAAGSRPATLDLGQVTHLGAAGVKVLFDVVGDTRRREVELVAPVGTVAQQVLDRVGLPYRA